MSKNISQINLGSAVELAVLGRILTRVRFGYVDPTLLGTFTRTNLLAFQNFPSTKKESRSSNKEYKKGKYYMNFFFFGAKHKHKRTFLITIECSFKM